MGRKDSLARHIFMCRLRGNRNDFATLHLRNLLVFEPGILRMPNVSNPYFAHDTKLKPAKNGRFEFRGRGERIRTFDTLVPNQVLYQTELRPETTHSITSFLMIASLILKKYLV